jgi:homogentisate 1,2-dioxygenase
LRASRASRIRRSSWEFANSNNAPYKYDLRRFNTIGSISFDHPDPSIFLVLHSASDTQGVSNIDFVIFPPRWLLAENTFRPPWFHRKASAADTAKPGHIVDTMAFMFESRTVIKPTRAALESASLHRNYQNCWADLAKRFDKEQP